MGFFRELYNEKVVTFYWTNTDDSDYPWTIGNQPAVYQGATKLTTTSWSDANPRQITVTLSGSFDSKGTYTIGREDDGTLPVELSSFTAVPYQTLSIMLRWVTQTETNVSGFRIYRGTDTELEFATMLDVFVPATNTSQTQYYIYYDREIFESGSYYYWLENVDYDGTSVYHGPVNVVLMYLNLFPLCQSWQVFRKSIPILSILPRRSVMALKIKS
jgi:hypothetical protein